jgi:hypothetical protein
MQVTEKKTKEVDEIVDITCDSCGKSCSKGEYGFEYMELKTNWGYASKKDLETWSAHLCEKCVDEKLDFIKFKRTRTRLF